MTISDNVFNLDNYLGLYKGKSDNNAQKIEDPEFASLQTKYAAQINAKLSDASVRQLYENKMVAQVFLDKTANTAGPGHPEVSFVGNFGYSSSTVASMQLIRYLKEIREDPRLSKETQQAIDHWIATESDYLPIAIIFDGWRSQNKEMVDFVEAKEKKIPKGGARAFKFNPDPKEVEVLSKSLARQMGAMVSGQSFKMLGGFNIHETRLLIQKEATGKFTVYHYNTGFVMDKEGARFGHMMVDISSTLSKIPDVSSEKLSDPNFWKEFIDLKFSEPDMKKMESFLKRQLGESDPIFDLMMKPQQKSDACPVQAAEAEFKHRIINAGTDNEEGLVQYKIVKSLISEKALELEKGRVDPKLYAMMEEKESVKHRYLYWWEIAKEPAKFEQVKSAYIELITSLSPGSEAKIQEAMKGHSPLICLRNLDNMLNKLLIDSSAEKVEGIMQVHATLFTMDQTPILCMKYYPHAKKIAESVEKVRASSETFPGNVMSRLRGIASSIASVKIQKMLDPYLRGGEISHLGLVEVLKEYIKLEKSEKSLPVIQDLLNHSFINLDDVKALFESQIKSGHPSLLQFLAEKSLGHPSIDRRLCLAVADPPRLLKELDELSRKKEQWMDDVNLKEIVGLLSIGGHTTEMESILNLFHEQAVKKKDFELLYYEMEIILKGYGFPNDVLIQFFTDKVSPTQNQSYYNLWSILFEKKLSLSQQSKMMEAIVAKEGVKGIKRVASMSKISMHSDLIDNLYLERKIIDAQIYLALIDKAIDNPVAWKAKIDSLFKQGRIKTADLYPKLLEKKLNKKTLIAAELLLALPDLDPEYKLLCRVIQDDKNLMKDVETHQLKVADPAVAKQIISLSASEDVIRWGEMSCHKDTSSMLGACVQRLIDLNVNKDKIRSQHEIPEDKVAEFEAKYNSFRQKAFDLYARYLESGEVTQQEASNFLNKLSAEIETVPGVTKRFRKEMPEVITAMRKQNERFFGPDGR